MHLRSYNKHWKYHTIHTGNLADKLVSRILTVGLQYLLTAFVVLANLVTSSRTTLLGVELRCYAGGEGGKRRD